MAQPIGAAPFLFSERQIKEFKVTKRLSVCIPVCLMLLLPVLAYGYSLDIEIGESGVARLGSISSRSLVEDVLPGKVYETRVVPSGYVVTGYEVTWEQWSDVGPGEFQVIDGDRAGGVEGVSSGSLLGYGVVNVVVDPVRS